MSNLKKGQAVKARTLRGATEIAGTVAEVIETTKGAWIAITPTDKSVKPFKTRPTRVTAT